eukprot:TRINITY_DN6053_c0_g1_i7.p1 TRINITY_DN6053_c0_g1~~TRINITY_DN6053_c0_g1_i7.p1  ORF type:complete len:285 (-),score=47.12 TRINITY_DN6053_c0_g1_i7:258-1082(-)
MAKVLVRFVAQTRDGSLEAFEVAGPELQLQLGAVGAVAAQLGLAGGMDVPAAARILVVAAPRPQAPLWHAVDVRNDSTVLAKAELHEIPAGLRRVQGVAVAPNAQHVAVSVAEHVYLYEMSGRLTSVLRDSRETVWCLQFSPTSEVCAAGSNDRHIRLYAAGTGELLQTIETVQSVSFFAFHPVRAEIASGFYDFADFPEQRRAATRPGAAQRPCECDPLFARRGDGSDGRRRLDSQGLGLRHRRCARHFQGTPRVDPRCPADTRRSVLCVGGR